MVVVTGVNVYTNTVYTNNPWGIKGHQSFGEFTNRFVGADYSTPWILDGFNCLCGGNGPY